MDSAAAAAAAVPALPPATATAARRSAIEVRDLRVDYGSFVAVDDISLDVPEGEVFGLVGPNGAGKTSTFRVLATLMEPTYGEVRLCGIDVLEQAEATRRILGYMPDLAPVPSDLRAWEFLDFHADTHGLGNAAARRERIDECLAAVELSAERGAWCRALSRGQTQRLVLAKTLLHRPRVLILDEPASGLDPLSRRDLRMTLRRLAAEGVTVFVSSHILSELAEMCTSLCVMNRGQILASGTAEEVRATLGAGGRRLTATVVGDPHAAAAWLSERDGVTAVAVVPDGGVGCEFFGDGSAQAALLAAMVASGIPVRTFEEKRSSFEDILVGVAEGNRERRVP